MSPPPQPDFWNDRETTPEDIERGAANRLRVLEALIEHALTTEPLDASRVAQWHKLSFLGLSYVAEADECLLGNYRGSAHPRLWDMGVEIGDFEGVPPAEVQDAVEGFFAQLEEHMGRLRLVVEPDRDKSRKELLQIAALAGWAHGEWVRIHPFANGSGRTARAIANWVLVRFRLLPVVGIRPRPGYPYEPAAVASMRGNHQKIAALIMDLLENVERSR